MRDRDHVMPLSVAVTLLAVCLSSAPAIAQEGTITLKFSNVTFDTDLETGFRDMLPPSFVVVKLADDDPNDPDSRWPCRILPYLIDEHGERFIIQHVDPGEGFALINLSDERVQFTFQGPRQLFQGNVENPIWLEPDEIRLLRVRNNIKVTADDPESFVQAWNENCLSEYPGPFIMIP